jgi:hypothetical protein
MSEIAVRAALEQQIASITPTLITAFENQSFAPPDVSVPYQEFYVLFATPNNPEQGTGFQIQGYAQATLKYPEGVGTGAAFARALAIRAVFTKNRSFVNAGIITTITKTPAIGNGVTDGSRFVLPVKIPFVASIFN